MSSKRFIINLSAKKTEAGWGDAIDETVSAAVPKLFHWTSWSMLIGGLSYVESVSSNWLLVLLLAILSVGLTLNIVFTLSRIVVVWGEPELKEGRLFRAREQTVTLLLVGSVLFLMIFAVTETRTAIVEFQTSQASSPDD